MSLESMKYVLFSLSHPSDDTENYKSYPRFVQTGYPFSFLRAVVGGHGAVNDDERLKL